MGKTYDLVIDMNADTSHTRIIRLVGHGKRVLEFGCATGYMSRILSQQFGCAVTGIEVDAEAARIAQQYADRVIVGDAEVLDYDTALGDGRFDVVIFADVLEHLKDPLAVLRRIRPFLDPGGCALASIPNVAHSAVALGLLQGQFTYRPLGLLDDTHLRFFTKQTIHDVFESAGYAISRLDRLRKEPEATELGMRVADVPETVLEFCLRHEEATTYQFIVTAVPASEPHQARTGRDPARADRGEAWPEGDRAEPRHPSGVSMSPRPVRMDQDADRRSDLAGSNDGGRRFVVDLRRSSADVAQLREALVTRLGSVEEIEIAAHAPLSSDGVRRLLTAVRDRSRGRVPGLLLRCSTLGDPAGAPELFAGLGRVVVEVEVDAQPDHEEIKRAAELQGIGVSVRVCLLVGPLNWYEVGPLLSSCDALGIRLRLATQSDAGSRPLGELSLDEIRFVCLALDAEASSFAEGARRAGVSRGEYQEFLQECHAIHRDCTEAALRGEPLEGTGRIPLRLPPLAHASVSDEASLIGLLRLLGRIPASSAVGEWMHAIVASRGFAEQARVRFSLRWIAFWADSVFRDVAARDALRTIYGDEGAREQLLADDRDGAARLGLDPGLGVGARLHGLDRVSARPRAFAVSTVPVARRRAATPDVTVVIPSYNHERYVEDAIGSVLTQTYEAFRVVVSDDCSTDATVERARAVGDDRVRVLARTRNVGLGNNLRAALAAVDTPYVAILNSDDLFHPERLERCRTALERRPEAALAATDLTLVDVRGRVLTPESTSALLDGPEVVGSVTWYYRARQETAQARSLAEALLEQNFLATSSNVFCRTAFLRDRIDGLADLKYCVDWQLFLDAAIDDALVHIPEELLAYRLHDTNTVWLRDRDRWPFLLEVNRVVARGVRRRLARAIEGRDKSADHSLVAGVMDRVLRNGNFDGLTLFFQGMLPEGELEALGRESAELRARLEELEGRVRRRWAMTEVWRAMGGDAHSVAALPHELRTLRVQRNAAEVEADASRDALRRAHASREWRIGRFLWNRTGLAKAALALSRAARIRDS